MSLGAVILAAGASARLGRPKQLIEFEGEALLRRAAQSAVEAGCAPVVVVLGAVEAGCREILRGLPVEITVHADWRDGMASSIAAGIAMLEARGVAAALLMVCDQPRINAESLRRLSLAFQGHAIAAAHYHGTLGTPAIFAQRYFSELRGLSGQRGAKVLLRRHTREVVAVDLPEAAFDIDTASDLGAE